MKSYVITVAESVLYVSTSTSKPNSRLSVSGSPFTEPDTENRSGVRVGRTATDNRDTAADNSLQRGV
ncbi:unnamed protein product, partial [Iphiclides podalirius]